MTKTRASRPPALVPLSPARFRLVLVMIIIAFAVLSGRLFYWQVVKSVSLQIKAQEQYQQTQRLTGQRGSIYTEDGYLLVGNKTVYRLFVEPPLVTTNPQQLSSLLSPYVASDSVAFQEASEAAVKAEILTTTQHELETKLARPNMKWVGLASALTSTTKEAIERLDIKGIGFEPYFTRYYPQASMAAHVTGFVGKNDEGIETGYFGVEGALDQELKGRTTKHILETDALGIPFLNSNQSTPTYQDGRDVTLTIRRDVQFTVEELLKKGVERYGAKSGEVIVMEPSTGNVVALATWPHYDQQQFFKYPTDLYKNPTLSESYEPGSTFKTLTVSAGIEEKKITPDTVCPICDQARAINGYNIKTWNNQYNPQVSMRDALAKSDNVAMTYIAEQLGSDVFERYLHAFKIGEKVGIDLQEDRGSPFPSKWGPVELFTRSFGQGITTNSLQLIKAVSVIANKGVMMKPTIVKKVVDPATQQELTVTPQSEGQIISPETAKQVTEMMVHAAQKGEAQWIASHKYVVAAKTGTSQVVENGVYSSDKTITSFIGFTPADEPKFIMLVKLVEPTSSPWAAETAAPLWYQIADRLALYFQLVPLPGSQM